MTIHHKITLLFTNVANIQKKLTKVCVFFTEIDNCFSRIVHEHIVN